MKKVIFFSLLLCFFSAFAVAQFKPVLTGLVCRDFKRIKEGDEEVMKNISAIVVQLHWNDIQLTEGGPIERNNKLDEAIKWVRAFKEKYGITIGLKARLYCGIHSPDWLINKVGYFTLKDAKVPKFWKEDFVSAFADAQSKLAAIYDDVPEIQEVVDGCTGVLTAESFIRPFRQGPNGQAMSRIFFDAGYTAEADSIAIVKSFDAMKVWKKTLVSVCFSDWKTLDKGGNPGENVNRTFGFIQIFINKFNEQAVIGNNGLRPGIGHHGARWQEGGDMHALYNYFKKIHNEQGVHIYFQTAADSRIGNLQEAIKDGIAYGASYIELPGPPSEYTGDLPGTAMPELNKQLHENVKR